MSLRSAVPQEGRLEEARHWSTEMLESARGDDDPETLYDLSLNGVITALRGPWQEAEGHLAELFHGYAQDEFVLELCDLMYVPVLIRLEDYESYENLRQTAVARYAKTDSPRAAERIARACLLLTAGDELMNTLEQMQAVVEQGQQNWSEGRADCDTPWTCVELALMDYRLGDWTRSFQWSEGAVELAGEPGKFATSWPTSSWSGTTGDSANLTWLKRRCAIPARSSIRPTPPGEQSEIL